MNCPCCNRPAVQLPGLNIRGEEIYFCRPCKPKGKCSGKNKCHVFSKGNMPDKAK